MGVNSKLPPRTELNFCFETPVPPKGGDLILVNSAVNPPPFLQWRSVSTILGKGLWSLSSVAVSTC